MWYKAILIAFAVFGVFFLLLLFRTFSIKKLKSTWKNAVRVGTQKYDYLRKAAQLKLQGLKEYSFDNGGVTVFAKNEAEAKAKHRIMVNDKMRSRTKRRKLNRMNDAVLRKG